MPDDPADFAPGVLGPIRGRFDGFEVGVFADANVNRPSYFIGLLSFLGVLKFFIIRG